MRRTYVILAAIGLTSIASAQGQTETSSGSQSARIVTWSQGTAGTDRLLKGGLVVALLTVDGVAVAVSVVRTDDLLWANVSVANQSGSRVDVDPATFTLDAIEPKAKRLAYQEPERIARSMRRRAEWGAALTAIAGEMATTETKTEGVTNVTASARDNEGYRVSGQARGTTTVTTRSKDQQASDRAAADAERITSTATTKAADLLGRSLKANTLLPGEQIGGAVFFDRDKRARQVMLRVPIGAVVYAFPYSIQ